MAAIKFDRTPYNVTYMENGEQKTIRRVPPPKLHDTLPEDQVQLNLKKNDDWVEGETYTVADINPRQPNTLQITKGNGERTFVAARDTTLVEKKSVAPGEDIRDLPSSNRYLLWP